MGWGFFCCCFFLEGGGGLLLLGFFGLLVLCVCVCFLFFFCFFFCLFVCFLFLVTIIHPSRMSGSFESVRWNVRVHRLDLGLHSHPKELWGNGVRTHVNSKRKKIPSTGKKISPEEDRTHDAASSRTASPALFQRAILGP